MDPDCKQTRLFFPEPNPPVWKEIKAFNNLTPTKLGRIVRFITVHTFMNRHEVLIQRGRADLESEDVLCRLCEEERETPEHLLCECPVLNSARLQFLEARQLNRVPDWDKRILEFIMLPELATLEE